jgi:Protein of unknown function (DUF3558)
MKRLLHLLPAAALLLGGFGCSRATPDRDESDSARNSSVTTASRPTVSGEATKNGGAPGVAALRPCELLTASEQSGLSLAAGTARQGTFPSCLWKADDHEVVVAILSTVGLDRLLDTPASERLTVNSRPAVQSTRGGTCTIGLEVTDSSRVDIHSTTDAGLDRACQVTRQAAEMVEPKLP